MDVVLVPLLGQSNIIGLNAIDGLDADITDVYQYGGQSALTGSYNQLSSDITPLGHPDNTIYNRVGPGISALAKIKAQHPTAMIVAIPCGVGSIGLVGAGWQSSPTPGAGGIRFEFAVNQFAAAQAAALAAWPGATIIKRTLFVQGEQDAATSVPYATYYTALANFIADWDSRTGMTGVFVIGSMLPQKWIIGSPNYLAAYADINRAHVMASLNIANVLYSRGPDNRAANDNLHYQPAAVARQQGDYLGDTLADTTAPTMTSANSYSNVAGSALAFPLTASDTYDHTTFHINGGADAALFDISDPYINPTLRWLSNGTGPVAGTYVVGLRARDGAGNYSTTQTFTLTVSAEVSPVTFFTSGERGAVWDLSDLSTLFQNVAGTTPVTAAGQTVGKILDLSPNANHWTAAADNTTRPTYQVDSDGRPYLQFDGSNDILFGATPHVTTTNGRFTTIMGLLAAAPASTRYAIGSYSTATTTPFVEPIMAAASGGTVQMSMRNDGSSGMGTSPTLVGILDGTNKRIVTSQYNGNGSTMRMRSDAGSYSTTTQGTFANNFAVTRAALGGRGYNTPANFWSGRLYSGFNINKYLSDADIAAGYSWVANRVRAPAAIPVTADNTAHITAASEPTLGIAASISPDNAAHVTTAGSATLAAGSTVAPSSSVHDTAASQATLAAASSIAPDNAAHVTVASAAALVPHDSVAPDSAAHATAASSPTVAPAGTVQPASSAHDTAATSPTVIPRWALAPDSAANDNVATEPTLGVAGSITPATAAHVTVANSPSLTAAAGAIAPANSAHATAATQPSLGSGGSVQPASATNDTAANSPALVWHPVLVPASSAHITTASIPTLSGSYVPGHTESRSAPQYRRSASTLQIRASHSIRRM